MATADDNAAVVGFDGEKVMRLVARGGTKGERRRLRSGQRAINPGATQVTGAIRQMMQHRTLVNEVTLDTPEEQYRYELRRSQGYVKLIPVASDMRAPPATVTAMRASVDKAQWMFEQAKAKASAGDYTVAIRIRHRRRAWRCDRLQKGMSK